MELLTIILLIIIGILAFLLLKKERVLDIKTEENKIRGCVSNLWVTGKVLEDGTMQYRHDADAFVTKGTAKILIDIVNGEHRSEVANLKMEDFRHLGIKELLTMQRQIGFASLIERIITIAKND